VGSEAAPSAVVTLIGPVVAPTGTRTLKPLSERPRTRTETSSPRPKLPWKVTLAADESEVPVILIVLPPCARAREAQRRTQVTFATFGVAT
jgi:hypothetical protein